MPAAHQDPVRAGLLYLGTEHGVYVSFDDGGHWESLRLNLPVTPVHDIVVEGNDVVIATHGRGFYVLDDVGVLRQLTTSMRADAARLFEPSPATRGVSRGAVIDYYLPRGADTITLQFLDARGTVVRTVTTPAPRDTEPMPEGVTESSRARIPTIPARAGVNRFVWDLRSAPLHDFPGLIMYQTDTRGPVVPPGRYTVRLTAGGQTLTQPLVIKKDARLKDVTAADLDEQYRLAREIGASFSKTSDMVVRIRRLKAQTEAGLKDVTDAGVRAAADTLMRNLTSVEGDLYQYRNRATKDPLNFPPELNNKLAVLLSVVDAGEGRPTSQSYTVFRELSATLRQIETRLDAILNKDVPAYAAKLARVRPVVP